MGSALRYIPSKKTFGQRERRPIVYAVDLIKALWSLVNGLDSNNNLLVAFCPPVINDLFHKCDELVFGVGRHAPNNHCVNASFETQLRPLITPRVALKTIADTRT